MKTRDDERLVTEIKKALDASVETLPAYAVNHLREARQQALAGKVKTHRPWLAFPRWVTAGGLATAAVAILTVSLWVAVPRPQKPVVDDELDQITSQEQLEFYEDLEFFRWLADNKDR